MKAGNVLLAAMLFSLCAVAQSRHKNTVTFNTNAFCIPKRMLTFKLMNQVGITYERAITSRLSVSAGYFRWRPEYPLSKHERDYFIEEPYLFRSLKPVGSLTARIDYRMADLAVKYKWLAGKYGTVRPGLGISYCWGDNSYVEWSAQYPYFPYEMSYTFYKKSVHYWGIVPQVSYRYNFLKDRLCAGIDVRARYYAGRPQAQYDYGLHLGVNF